MRLSTRSLLALFAVGAACGLIGDHAHVESGATRYLDVGGVPMIWGSPLFFMISVGLATAALAEIGLRLGGPRGGSAWDGLAAAASVLAIYLVTAVLADESTSTVTALIACLAALVLVRFGENRRGAIVCGALAAIVGPLVEIVEQRAGIFDVHRQRRRPLGRCALAGTALLRLRSRRRSARRAAGGGAGGRGLSENPRVSKPEHSRPPSFLRATMKEQVRLFSIRPPAPPSLLFRVGRWWTATVAPRVCAAVRGRRADRLRSAAAARRHGSCDRRDRARPGRAPRPLRGRATLASPTAASPGSRRRSRTSRARGRAEGAPRASRLPAADVRHPRRQPHPRDQVRRGRRDAAAARRLPPRRRRPDRRPAAPRGDPGARRRLAGRVALRAGHPAAQPPRLNRLGRLQHRLPAEPAGDVPRPHRRRQAGDRLGPRERGRPRHRPRDDLHHRRLGRRTPDCARWR